MTSSCGIRNKHVWKFNFAMTYLRWGSPFCLTHCDQYEMTDFADDIFKCVFSQIKMFQFYFLHFHWNMFLRALSTIIEMSIIASISIHIECFSNMGYKCMFISQCDDQADCVKDIPVLHISWNLRDPFTPGSAAITACSHEQSRIVIKL